MHALPQRRFPAFGCDTDGKRIEVYESAEAARRAGVVMD
jgi:hypothetical protein